MNAIVGCPNSVGLRSSVRSNGRALLPTARRPLPSRAPALHTRSSRRATACHAAAQDTADACSSASEAKELLSSEQAQSWEACHAMLVDTGLSAEDADRLLAKGFAWTSRGYWGLEKANVVPDPDDVIEVLQYLEGELGLTGPDLGKVVKMFPEVLACSIEERLRPNVRRFEAEWFMKGDVLRKAILRKPTLLGLSVDCSTVGSGACQGQCSKCWSAN